MGQKVKLKNWGGHQPQGHSMRKVAIKKKITFLVEES